MSLTANCESEENFSENSIQPELKTSQLWLLYVITYSQVDLSKSPTCNHYSMHLVWKLASGFILKKNVNLLMETIILCASN